MLNYGNNNKFNNIRLELEGSSYLKIFKYCYLPQFKNSMVCNDKLFMFCQSFMSPFLIKDNKCELCFKNYNDHLNSGFMIYQPKYHGEMIKKLYDDNIDNYQKYHQDDQSILSSFLIDNDLIYWLDQRYNRVWYFWKEIMYPDFDLYEIRLQKKLVENFVNLNYFCHFTSMVDIDLL